MVTGMTTTEGDFGAKHGAAGGPMTTTCDDNEDHPPGLPMKTRISPIARQITEIGFK